MANEKEMTCSELVKRLYDAFETRVNNSLLEEELTLSQLKMLRCLDATWEGELTLKEMEKYFGASQATIAGIAARLQKKGFVEGYTDPADKRIKRVRLTDEGTQACTLAETVLKESEQWLARGLDSREQKELQKLLQKAYEGLED